MTEQFLDNLKHIHPEPVPETVWPNIQRAIAQKRLQLAPVWMRIAAAMIVLVLLGEVISSVREQSRSRDGNPYGTIFKPNNQWYND
jgi:hypothetical protein